MEAGGEGGGGVLKGVGMVNYFLKIISGWGGGGGGGGMKIVSVLQIGVDAKALVSVAGGGRNLFHFDFRIKK